MRNHNLLTTRANRLLDRLARKLGWQNLNVEVRTPIDGGPRRLIVSGALADDSPLSEALPPHMSTGSKSAVPLRGIDPVPGHRRYVNTTPVNGHPTCYDLWEQKKYWLIALDDGTPALKDPVTGEVVTPVVSTSEAA